MCGLPEVEQRHHQRCISTAPYRRQFGRIKRSQVLLDTRFDKRVLASGNGTRRQRENGILYQVWTVPIQGYAVWPEQRTGDFRETDGDCSTRNAMGKSGVISG